MINPLINNAFNILGIRVDSTTQEILKRAKEIRHRINIDDIPEYEIDSKSFTLKRTDLLIHDAIKKLENKDERVKEFFFWFNFTKKEEYFWELFNAGENHKLILELENLKTTKSIDTLHKKKNIAILKTLLLENGSDSDIKDSLESWKEVVEYDNGWKALGKEYILIDNSTNEKTLSLFRKKVIRYLSDIYIYLYKKTKNDMYIKNFQGVFVLDISSQKEILKPIVNSICEKVEILENLDATADGKLDETEKKTIDDSIEFLLKGLKKIENMELYDVPEVKLVRGRVATIIRNMAVELTNELYTVKRSIKLIEISLSIAESESLKNRLKKDIEDLMNLKTTMKASGIKDGEGSSGYFEKIIHFISSNIRVLFILFIIAIFFLSVPESDYSSNTTSSESNIKPENSYNYGTHECSSYHHSKLSEWDKSLNIENDKIKKENQDIDTTYVNNYSQESVDAYNDKVLIQRLLVNEYNTEVDKRNKYLETNCRKI